jgi:hypothetical protein
MFRLLSTDLLWTDSVDMLDRDYPFDSSKNTDILVW